MPIYFQDMTIFGILAIAFLFLGTVVLAIKSAHRLRWYVAVPLLIALPLVVPLPVSFAVELFDSHGRPIEQGGWWIASALAWSFWLVPIGLLTYVGAIVTRWRWSGRGTRRAL